jgi:hypothetical protein
MLTYATKEELLEAVFSMQSATTAKSYHYKSTARRGVFCAAHAEII